MKIAELLKEKNIEQPNYLPAINIQSRKMIEKSLASGFFEIPKGLSKEERRDFCMKQAGLA